MAIARGDLTSGLSTSTANSYTTASISPTGNALILVSCVVRKSDTPDTPAVTGNGITYTLIDSNHYDTGGTQTKIFLFRGLASSPSSGVITFDFSGVDQLGMNWSVNEFTGVDTGGTNGADAIVQSKTGSTFGTSLTITYDSAFADSGNRPFCGFGDDNNNENFTPRTNWTELHELTSPVDAQTQWRDDGTDTAASTTWGSDENAAGIAVEIGIVAAVAPTGQWNNPIFRVKPRGYGHLREAA